MNKEVLIIGGGIGGLSTALSIAKAGKRVIVMEQALEFSEVGAGLQMGPNGTAALDKLGVLDEVKKHAVFPKRIVLKSAVTGMELSSLDLGDNFIKRYNYPYMVMHRADLLDVLLKACQGHNMITLKTNKKVSSILRNEKDSTVYCEDGSSYSAKAIIAADGLKSVTRKVIKEDEMVCSRFVAYRGTLPIETVVEYAELNDVVCWIGPGYHLVQYPVRRKELYNQVAVFESKSYQPDKENTTLWGTKEELKDVFNNSNEHVKKAIEHIDVSVRWPLYDREPLDNWQNGNIVLIGDSAHPMLQYLAQGACQALEDAVCIAEKISNQSESFESAFTAYQEERIPRTKLVQERARVFGDILHAKNNAMVLVRNSLLEKMDSQNYEIVDWLYGKPITEFSDLKGKSIRA